MPRKVGELVIDLILGRSKFDRELDDSARKAEQAGRKMQDSADRATRSYQGLNVQVGALAQRLAGIGSVAAGAGAIASVVRDAQASNQQFESARRDIQFSGDNLGLVQQAGALRAQRDPSATSGVQQAFRNARLAALTRQSQEAIRLRQEAGNKRLFGLFNIGGVGVSDIFQAFNEQAAERRAALGIGGPGDGLDRFNQGSFGVSANARVSELDRLQRGQNLGALNQINANERLAIENVGITSSPQFQAASQISQIEQMVLQQQRTNDLLQQLAAQAAATPPGGAVQ